MINSDEHYRSIIEDKDSLIDELYGDIEDLKTQLELANDDIDDLKTELKLANDDIDDKQELINYLNSIIKNLSGEIERLGEEVQLYQRDCMGKN